MGDLAFDAALAVGAVAEDAGRREVRLVFFATGALAAGAFAAGALTGSLGAAGFAAFGAGLGFAAGVAALGFGGVFGPVFGRGLFAAVEGAFEDLRSRFVGRDPDAIEEIWQEAYRGRFYRGGPVLMVIHYAYGYRNQQLI